jgi:hypothetical protein
MLIESSTITSPSSLFDRLVLDHLRVAHLKGRLIVNRTAFAATALKQGWVDGETALEIVGEANLLDFVVGRSSHE